jgi:hypothetical protein
MRLKANFFHGNLIWSNQCDKKESLGPIEHDSNSFGVDYRDPFLHFVSVRS